MKKDTFSFSREFIGGELTLGFWSFVKKAVGVFDSYFVLDALTVYQYGFYQLLLSAYAFFSDFFHDLFSSVIVNDIARFIGEKKEGDAKRLYGEHALFRLLMGLLPCAAIFIGTHFVTFGYGPDVIASVRILGLMFVVDAFVNTCLVTLKLRLEFAASASRPTLQKLAQFGILAYFYFSHSLGIKEIFLAQLLSPLVALIVMIPALQRALLPWKGVAASKEKHFRRIIFSYGKWEVPQFFFRDLIGKIRPWLIRIFLTTEAVGLFSIANTAISLLKDALPTRTLNLLLPRKAADPKAIGNIMRRGTKYYLLFGLVMALGGGIAYPPLLLWLFPQYKNSIGIFYILLPSVLVFSFIKLINVVVVVDRKQRFVFFQSVLQNFITIALYILFVPFGGLLGVASAETLGLAVASGLKYRYLVQSGSIEKFSWKTLFTIEAEDRALVKKAFGMIHGKRKAKENAA